MSVTRSPAVTARAMTEMSSAAWRPTIEPPSTTPVAGSEMIFTKPRGSFSMSALALAENGTLVTRILRPVGEGVGLGQADVGDLGHGEDGRRRLVVVEVPVRAGVQAHDVLGDLAALHRGDRRQRQLARQVAGGVDVRHGRLAVVVDDDVAAVGLDARRRRARGPRSSGIEPMASSAWEPGGDPTVVAAHGDPVVVDVDADGPGALEQPHAASRKSSSSAAATSGSFCGSTCWRLTISVTWQPNDENMWTNSTPVTPEPITTRCSGSSGGG